MIHIAGYRKRNTEALKKALWFISWLKKAKYGGTQPLQIDGQPNTMGVQGEGIKVA